MTHLCLVATLLLSSCDSPATAPTPTSSAPTESPTLTVTPWEAVSTPTRTPRPTATPIPPTPTPDAPRTNTPALSALGEGWAAFSYKVQPGEDLGIIGARYGLSIQQMRAANGFVGGEVLLPGQIILVPQLVQRYSPTFKLVPDSELVYGPSTVDFDIAKFVATYKRGYLYHYTETVNGEEVSGAALIQRAAENYSVDPRLLLALLEYQSGWLTQSEPTDLGTLYPFGRTEGGTEGLYRQLQWAANAFNRGFYEWRDGSLSLLILGDGTRVGLNEGLNAGTASLQYVFSLTTNADEWESAVGPEGFFKMYTRLFGDPFANAVEPLVASSLSQPELGLPWQGGETWFYSGGPHGSYGSGAPWGAIDFLPPGRESGCGVSPNWVTAVAQGLVVRSGDGQLLLDLDQDGYEQTGWVILYLHVAEQDRPAAGTTLVRGDKVGHASCEGGFAQDAHVHIARKYNGVWLAANDRLAPFVVGGYTVRSTGSEYNGLLEGSDVAKQACACRDSSNAITK
ncbi:MAG: LysM domain-containing protein [Chloroflexota bacterium]